MFGSAIVVTPPPFDHTRRLRSGMKFNHPTQLHVDQCTGLGYIDDGTVADGRATPPRIIANAGPAANEVASAWEWFNQDPTADPTRAVSDTLGRGDAYFSGRIKVAAYAMRLATGGLGTPAGPFWGIGVGSPWEHLSVAFAVGNGIENDNNVHWSLRFTLSTGIWSLVVVNKWAAPGSRRFVKNLGTSSALGLPTTIGSGSGIGCHCEIVYTPNVGIDAYIDGRFVGSFRDSDAGANTPFAQIYANKNAVGSTIKGAGFFVGTGIEPAYEHRVCFTDFYREMEAHF